MSTATAVTSPTGVTTAESTTAPAVAAAGGTSAAPGAAGPVAWTDSITDVGVRDFAVNKGYNKEPLDKIAPTIIQQYQNLEKIVGAEKAGRTVEIPDFDKADANAQRAFYERIGAPKEGKDYDLAVPKDKPLDAGFEKFARDNFQKAGLSVRQGKIMGEAWNNYAAEVNAKVQADATAQYESEDKALKTEWGAAYDNKLSRAQAAAKSFGVDPKALDALQKAAGYGAVIKVFANIAEKLGEDTFISGEGAGTGGVMTPAEANTELKKLAGDKEWMASWLDKSHPKHKEAVARKAQLTAFLAGTKV